MQSKTRTEAYLTSNLKYQILSDSVQGQVWHLSTAFSRT